jgi:hypothetical protein
VAASIEKNLMALGSSIVGARDPAGCDKVLLTRFDCQFGEIGVELTHWSIEGLE